jgi:hypothetical protein
VLLVDEVLLVEEVLLEVLLEVVDGRVVDGRVVDVLVELLVVVGVDVEVVPDPAHIVVELLGMVVVLLVLLGVVVEEDVVVVSAKATPLSPSAAATEATARPAMSRCWAAARVLFMASGP